MVKQNFYHNKEVTAHLNLLNTKGPTRNAYGEITKDAAFQTRKCKPVSRINPNRKWFCNTKMITQNELDNFRNTVETKSVYQVLLSKGKVPYSLLSEEKGKRGKVEYRSVFGKRATRKRPKIGSVNVNDVVNEARHKQVRYEEKILAFDENLNDVNAFDTNLSVKMTENNIVKNDEVTKRIENDIENNLQVILHTTNVENVSIEEQEKINNIKEELNIKNEKEIENKYVKELRNLFNFSNDDKNNKKIKINENVDLNVNNTINDESKTNETKKRPVINNTTYVKGQSRRIWNELYKVIDSSDVIIHVLDARDPLGTKCVAVQKYLEDHSHKHLIYVINKVDLVPTAITAKWLRILSKEKPTVAYHSSSMTNFYGKNNLTNLLRQFSNLHNKKEISVGFVGFPNVGKSSIINTLRNKKVCKVAPVPGETKVWQYITLSSKMYLIDCPGIVPMSGEKEAVLRGAVRIENVKDPEFYVIDIIEKARNQLVKTYGFKFTDCEDFLEKIAVRFGKIIKNGEKDTSSAAKIVLHDWCKGKIPFYVEPVE